MGKISLCHYSGYKIHPGHGKTMVRVDGKVYHFLDSKCERAHLMKRNPRNTTWTVLYRRKHKKGQEEEQAKKKTRKTQKFQRAIVGASLTEILAKRNQNPKSVRHREIRPSRLPRKRPRLPRPRRKLLLPHLNPTRLPPSPRLPAPRKLLLVLVENAKRLDFKDEIHLSCVTRKKKKKKKSTLVDPLL